MHVCPILFYVVRRFLPSLIVFAFTVLLGSWPPPAPRNVDSPSPVRAFPTAYGALRCIIHLHRVSLSPRLFVALAMSISTHVGLVRLRLLPSRICPTPSSTPRFLSRLFPIILQRRTLQSAWGAVCYFNKRGCSSRCSNPVA